MSENFLKADDVTMELATVLDEYSAVDCYKLKKNAPFAGPGKKIISYKDIIQTNFPGTPIADSKYILPDSIDMDYIEILSGKNLYISNEEEARIPITIESFEKLCYYPDLTEAQKRRKVMIEKAKEEEEIRLKTMIEKAKEEEETRLRLLAQEAEANVKEVTSCSPCLSRSSATDDLQSLLKESDFKKEKVSSSAPSTSGESSQESSISRSPKFKSVPEKDNEMKSKESSLTSDTTKSATSPRKKKKKKKIKESSLSSDTTKSATSPRKKKMKKKIKAQDQQISEKSSSREKKKKSIIEKVFSLNGKNKRE